jgi:ParB-like chromosome segregation protein Spo0J
MNHDNTITEVACDAIRIGERHRKDLGDLEALAASIATEGLLQPVGITEDNLLVFGERRLRAVQEILKYGTIATRVVHVRSITAGEYAENEIRKDFTPSERVAIGKTLEAGIGGRQGSRTDLELGRNCGEVPGRTVDVAAQKAGFGSAETYERAKSVVDRGAPELVQAMDAGGISIHAASVIATQPADRQAEIVQTPRELRRQIVREIRDAIDLPTTSEARRMARESGMLVADRTGRYRSGASTEERAATKADLDAIWDVTRGVLAIADAKLDPEELAARLEYWHCPEIRAKTPLALAWLTKFQKGVENNDQIS